MHKSFLPFSNSLCYWHKQAKDSTNKWKNQLKVNSMLSFPSLCLIICPHFICRKWFANKEMSYFTRTAREVYEQRAHFPQHCHVYRCSFFYWFRCRFFALFYSYSFEMLIASIRSVLLNNQQKAGNVRNVRNNSHFPFTVDKQERGMFSRMTEICSQTKILIEFAVNSKRFRFIPMQQCFSVFQYFKPQTNSLILQIHISTVYLFTLWLHVQVTNTKLLRTFVSYSCESQGR